PLATARVRASCAAGTLSLLAILAFFLMIPPPPRSTLFPYTTLFRSSSSFSILSGGTSRAGNTSLGDRSEGSEPCRGAHLIVEHQEEKMTQNTGRSSTPAIPPRTSTVFQRLRWAGRRPDKLSRGSGLGRKRFAGRTRL